MSSGELRAINGVAPEFVSVSLRSDADQKLISRSILAQDEITPWRNNEILRVLHQISVVRFDE